MNPASEKLFAEQKESGKVTLQAAADFLEQAGEGEYCFVENTGLQAVEAKIEKIIVFWWNRHYPSDRKFDLDLSKWNKVSEEEFAGYSHEKITKEVYEKMKKLRKQLLLLAALLALTLTGCEAQDLLSTERADSGSEVTAAYTMTESQITDQAPTAVSVLDVPEFSGEPYVVLNGNEPDFTDEEKTTESYEHYSDLDSLGRCGVAEANIGQDLMPTEKRGAIGQVKPTGWHTVKYDQVEGKYLYNRCHLIGYQLTGENANEKNLITGTRYLNVEGMLPFENMVADYVKETGNHVLYRVTPIFTGDNLVADGVEMEALSMEDDGEGISFHISHTTISRASQLIMQRETAR